MTCKHYNSIPKTSLNLVKKVHGVPEIGMAISYNSWLGHDSEDSNLNTATLALITVCAVLCKQNVNYTETETSYGIPTGVLADYLKELQNVAEKSQNGMARSGIFKTDQKDIDILPGRLLSMSNEVRRHNVVLADVIYALSMTSNSFFRNVVVAAVVSLIPQLESSNAWNKDYLSKFK